MEHLFFDEEDYQEWVLFCVKHNENHMKMTCETFCQLYRKDEHPKYLEELYEKKRRS